MSKTFHLTVNGTALDFTEDQAEVLQEALSEAVKKPGQSIYRETQSGPVSARMTAGGQPGGAESMVNSNVVLTDC